MLTDDVIKEAVKSGLLTAVAPGTTWAPSPRAFLMCRPLEEAVKAGRTDDSENIRKRWAALEAAMQNFVEIGHMTERILKQLCPYKYEHWELINTAPKPSLRIFGRFAKPDVFVGTHVVARTSLRHKWSPEFEHEKLVCEDHWKQAGLPECPPPGAFTDFSAFRYEKYITENAVRKLRVLP